MVVINDDYMNINITFDFGKCKDSHVGSSLLPVLSAYSLRIACISEKPRVDHSKDTKTRYIIIYR